MLDFGYRWSDWRDALWTLRRVEDCDVYFAEATLRHDDLAGHARLAERVETRVCGAELAATVDECREWLERGRSTSSRPTSTVAAASPSSPHRRSRGPARCSGHPALLEDGRHRGGVTPLPGGDAERAVRRDVPSGALRVGAAKLTGPEPEIRDGRIALPAAPGLGIEVDEAVVERYRSDG